MMSDNAFHIAPGYLVILFVISIFSIFGQKIGVKRDPNEPPYIAPKIPYIGHAIGLILRKYKYYIKLK